MKTIRMILVGCLLQAAVVGTTQAALLKSDFISGVGVFSTTPDFGGTFAETSITNNSGMSDIADPGDPAATHRTINSLQWVTSAGHPTATLDFSLNGSFALSHIVWWNGNQGGNTNRGANLVNISTSADGGGTFQDLGNFNIAESAAASGGPEATIDLTSLMPVADFVRIDVLSNHGDAQFLTIREIRFYEGDELVTSVSAPVSLPLMGLGVLGMRFRRGWG